MKVVLFCGGRGVIDPLTRERLPKGMLRFGNRPVLWHIMKSFAAYGHTDFILALGEGGDDIRRYFFEFKRYARDVRISLETEEREYLSQAPEDDWTITLADTGDSAQTGARLARLRRYLEGEQFLVTYSDCLCNINMDELLEFHNVQDAVLTVTGVQPPSRFGTFFAPDGQVTGYTLQSRLVPRGGYLNGGYMALNPTIFEYLEPFNECNLEREVFTRLAGEGRVAVFPHDGYWQSVDTERDLQQLETLYAQNQRPWLPEPRDLI